MIISEFLKELRIGDLVYIRESHHPDVLEACEGIDLTPYIGEVAEVVDIDIKWDFPITLRFEDEDIQERFEQEDFDLWHESQVDYF